MAEAGIRRESPFSSSEEDKRPQRKAYVEIGAVVLLAFFGYYAKMEMDPSQQDIAYSVLGFVFLIMILKNVVYGLVAIVVAIGLSPDGVAGLPNMRLEDFMLPPLVIIWWLKRSAKGVPLVETEFMSAIKMYMLIAAISTLLGILRETVWPSYHWLIFYTKYAEYFVFAWFVLNSVKAKEDVILLLFATFMTCSVVAYISWTGRLEAIGENVDRFVRATGPEGETPNVLGGYYMMHIMMAFALLFAVKNYVYKLIILAFLFGVVLPLLYTYSRTSFSSMFLGLFVTSLFIDLRFVFVLVILLALSPILMPKKNFVKEDVVERYSEIFQIFDDEDGAPSSWKARTVGWYIFYTRTWNHDPIFGKGVGSIGLGIDSSYVKKFIESGILGLLAFAVLLIRIGRIGLYVAKVSKDSFYRAIGVGYMGVYAGMLVHAIGVSSFSTIRTAELFWLLTAITVGVSLIVKEENELEKEDEEDLDQLSFTSPFAASKV
ncbi:MAG: hypothetical protein HQL32_03305 [Planctomycetes bacterium]|nr:hypothetical protein [Planctomycetota bacterium]